MERVDQIARTKAFAIAIIKLVEMLSENRIGRIIGNQLLRSGTSVGANYRAACCSKSARDFINKLKIVEEEADETTYWLELLEESGLKSSEDLKQIKSEAHELISIFVAAIKTTKK